MVVFILFVLHYAEILIQTAIERPVIIAPGLIWLKLLLFFVKILKKPILFGIYNKKFELWTFYIIVEMIGFFNFPVKFIINQY